MGDSQTPLLTTRHEIAITWDTVSKLVIAAAAIAVVVFAVRAIARKA